MKIITDPHSFHKKLSRPLVLAIGNFDGFHRGHQKLLKYVRKQAGKHNAFAAVLTFRQHPHSILRPREKPLLLYGPEQKLFYLEQAGMDFCFLQSFTPAFSQLSPREFVEKILVGKLNVCEVVMGFDAHFGHGREGDTATMAAFAKEYGFLFRKMGPVMIGTKPVSSSLIRKLLIQGKMEKVRECLGRSFSLFGKVVHGKGHGMHLGFPTANLEVHSDIMIPRGVYVASGRMLSERRKNGARNRCALRVARCANQWLPGVMNFGKRPTYPASETPQPVLELYLLDFKGKIYGQAMEVAMHRFLRPERRFVSEEALCMKIAGDVSKARAYHQKTRRLTPAER